MVKHIFIIQFDREAFVGTVPPFRVVKTFANFPAAVNAHSGPSLNGARARAGIRLPTAPVLLALYETALSVLNQFFQLARFEQARSVSGSHARVVVANAECAPSAQARARGTGARFCLLKLAAEAGEFPNAPPASRLNPVAARARAPAP